MAHLSANGPVTSELYCSAFRICLNIFFRRKLFCRQQFFFVLGFNLEWLMEFITDNDVSTSAFPLVGNYHNDPKFRTDSPGQTM